MYHIATTENGVFIAVNLPGAPSKLYWRSLANNSKNKLLDIPLAHHETIGHLAYNDSDLVIVTSTQRVLMGGYYYNTCPTSKPGLSLDWTYSPKFDLLKDGEIITQVACGFAFIAFLTSTGRLFGFGYNFDGQLGLEPGRYERYVDLTPLFVPQLAEKETITQVACGREFTVCLTSTGRLFGMGDNSKGQLGLQEGSELCDLTPLFVPQLAEKETITQVACGREFTVCLTSTGRLFGMGDNSKGQLGWELNRRCDNLTPLFVPQLAEKEIITQVACGSHFTVFLTSAGRLFGMGDNSKGQLGWVSDAQRIWGPVSIGLPLLAHEETIIKMICYTGHMVLLTTQGRLIATGENRSTPTTLTYLSLSSPSSTAQAHFEIMPFRTYLEAWDFSVNICKTSREMSFRRDRPTLPNDWLKALLDNFSSQPLMSPECIWRYILAICYIKAKHAANSASSIKNYESCKREIEIKEQDPDFRGLIWNLQDLTIADSNGDYYLPILTRESQLYVVSTTPIIILCDEIFFKTLNSVPAAAAPQAVKLEAAEPVAPALDKLPYKIIRLIMEYLSPTDRLNLARTNKNLSNTFFSIKRLPIKQGVKMLQPLTVDSSVSPITEIQDMNSIRQIVEAIVTITQDERAYALMSLAKHFSPLALVDIYLFLLKQSREAPKGIRPSLPTFMMLM